MCVFYTTEGKGEVMENLKKRFLRFTVFLFAGMFIITIFMPRKAEAASVKYATYDSKSDLYKVGKNRYKRVAVTKGKKTTISLYQKKKKKWKKIATHKTTIGLSVKAEYGKWLYYTVYPFTGGQNLYRINLKSKKKYLVRKNVRHMLISGGKLYTNGAAVDARSVSIYISRTDGKKAKCIEKKADQAKMKIYKKRLYYLEYTYNKKTFESTNRLVSRKLNGKGKKIHTKKIKSPASILYYDNKSVVYAKPAADKTRYYKINIKTKKEKRINPSSKTIGKWISEFY